MLNILTSYYGNMKQNEIKENYFTYIGLESHPNSNQNVHLAHSQLLTCQKNKILIFYFTKFFLIVFYYNLLLKSLIEMMVKVLDYFQPQCPSVNA